MSDFITQPTVFLSIDEIEQEEFGDEPTLTNEIGVQDNTCVRKFYLVIKRTDVYYLVLKYVFHKGSSMKIFKRD
ncbi:MAG: hypothetical protein COA77_03630 [Thaumarchaeota archaeon]|nr:MAG: hypothetical protein COA77_03630 [Nitrososphaerota archaeon]